MLAAFAPLVMLFDVFSKDFHVLIGVRVEIEVVLVALLYLVEIVLNAFGGKASIILELEIYSLSSL